MFERMTSSSNARVSNRCDRPLARPELILFDEPSLGLAPKVDDEVYSAIRRFKVQGQTMPPVKQFANFVLTLADHANALQNSRIAMSGSAKTLVKHTPVRDPYIGISANSPITPKTIPSRLPGRD